MKKLLLLTSLILSGTLFSQTWTEQNTNYPVSGTYTGDISIVDANTVWTMAQRTTATNHQRFSKTTNGGTTWTTGTINVGNTTGLGIANISAVDANTAFAAVFPTVANAANQGIYKTIDGGVTWTRQTTAAFGLTSFVNFVHFWNANEGVCMGDKLGSYYEVYTTSNGGTTWTRTPFTGFAVSTGDYGYTGKFYVAGNTIWFGTDAGELMKSVNKGLNWTKITTPITDFGGGTITTVSGDFAFRDDNNGVIIKNDLDATGAFAGKSLYRTTNGGTNWTLVSPNTNMFQGAVAYAGSTMLVSAGSSTGNFGSSYSLNDGTTWTTIDALSHTSLSFLNDTVGFGGGFTTTGVGGVYKFTNNLATNTFKNNAFTTYPNPVKDFVTVTNKDNETFKSVSITDINGRTVKTVNAGDVSEFQINISDLNAGIYFMNIASENGTAVRKIIKN